MQPELRHDFWGLRWPARSARDHGRLITKVIKGSAGREASEPAADRADDVKPIEAGSV